ncbi:hypothetical protein K493DRAFT_308154 [Basidiobolus meristosporus CBS 931.73]|uniref:P-loop containing nucleoside triphosphate hydrolase protein n=1 Tax=Basidiobolus meristosporus CBS 931.73 TaxID=1314790 RepID=A0A1Y1X688_9FUNG|nr:hypothetical protein K493DRAFT_308154 [Basidiobolus meristosporus CBS 931.73]|eukprot:ORX81185.1 hypothetical protein K493DRAFT_308154 [Basidiobolus meristosporus CBS 931.73]
MFTWNRMKVLTVHAPCRTGGLARLFYNFCIKHPAMNIAWWIDEILFPLYHLARINQPVFILGQPRSGTTKLLDFLASNEQHVVALTLWEISYPILWVQYVAEYFSQYDERFFHNRLRAFFDPLPSGLDEVSKMHPMNMDNWEEDDIAFMFHFSFSAAQYQQYPSPECMNNFLNFRSLDKSLRTRLFDFHRKLIQKILYKRGNAQSIYMAKWVMCWTGEYELIQEIYPDARFVFIYRQPEESIPSLVKLFSGISIHTTHYDPFTKPEFRSIMLSYFYRAHEEELQYITRLLNQKSHVQIIEFAKLFENIPEAISKICTKLNIPLPKDYQEFLHQQQANQVQHKQTKVDESLKPEIQAHCSTFYERLTYLQGKE